MEQITEQLISAIEYTDRIKQSGTEINHSDTTREACVQFGISLKTQTFTLDLESI